MDKVDFRLIDPDSLPEPPGIWTADQWGEELFVGKATIGDHIKMRIVKAVEGVITVVRCAKCGGLSQHLTHLGEAFDLFRAGDVTAMRTRMNAAMPRELINEFCEKHAGCNVKPLVHHVPEDVQRFTEFLLDGLADNLASGESNSGMAHILTNDGFVLMADMGSLPPSNEGDRFSEAQRLQWMIREVVRTYDLDLLAVAFVSEAWASRDLKHGRPLTASDRYEVVVVTTMTQDYIVTGMGKIVRDSGIPEQGPGHIEDFEWQTTGGAECVLLEGILAT